MSVTSHSRTTPPPPPRASILSHCYYQHVFTLCPLCLHLLWLLVVAYQLTKFSCKDIYSGSCFGDTVGQSHIKLTGNSKCPIKSLAPVIFQQNLLCALTGNIKLKNVQVCLRLKPEMEPSTKSFLMSLYTYS